MPLTRPTKARWTAIIPAAGKGQRLGFEGPKALYPVLGKALLRHMLELVEPYCQKAVVVVAPQWKERIESALLEWNAKHWIEIRIQDSPQGMADAVYSAKGAVDTEFCLVVWTDQIALKSRTIRDSMVQHEKAKSKSLTIATIAKQDPYIYIRRDSGHRIIEVLQRREGEIKTAYGENDCGLFHFASRSLWRVLEKSRTDKLGVGPVSGEFNLLPLLPLFERELGGTQTYAIQSEAETIGINTPDDARKLEAVLRGEQ